MGNPDITAVLHFRIVVLCCSNPSRIRMVASATNIFGNLSRHLVSHLQVQDNSSGGGSISNQSVQLGIALNAVASDVFPRSLLAGSEWRTNRLFGIPPVCRKSDVLATQRLPHGSGLECVLVGGILGQSIKQARSRGQHRFKGSRCGCDMRTAADFLRRRSLHLVAI